MYNVSIPDISREELLARYAHIKPIVEIEGKKYFLRDFTEKELASVSCFRDIEALKKEPVGEEFFLADFQCDITCIHTYEFPQIFEPKIAEILAQIPDSEVPYVDAFEVLEPHRVAEESRKNQAIFDHGFHVSKVRLYTSRKNLKIIYAP